MWDAVIAKFARTMHRKKEYKKVKKTKNLSRCPGQSHHLPQKRAYLSLKKR
jgi:hypothetical protein